MKNTPQIEHTFTMSHSGLPFPAHVRERLYKNQLEEVIREHSLNVLIDSKRSDCYRVTVTGNAHDIKALCELQKSNATWHQPIANNQVEEKPQEQKAA